MKLLLHCLLLLLVLGPGTALYVSRPAMPHFYGSDDCDTLFYAYSAKDTKTLFVGGTTWSKKITRDLSDPTSPCYSDVLKRAVLLKRTIDPTAADESADFFFEHEAGSYHFNLVTALYQYTDKADSLNYLMLIVSGNSLSFSELTGANEDKSKIYFNKICITLENFGSMNCFISPRLTNLARIMTSYHFTQPTCCFRDDN